MTSRESCQQQRSYSEKLFGREPVGRLWSIADKFHEATIALTRRKVTRTYVCQITHDDLAVILQLRHVVKPNWPSQKTTVLCLKPVVSHAIYHSDDFGKYAPIPIYHEFSNCITFVTQCFICVFCVLQTHNKYEHAYSHKSADKYELQM